MERRKRGKREGRESLNAARTRGSTVVYASRCPGLYVSSRGLFRRARRPVSITQAATAAAATDESRFSRGSRPPSIPSAVRCNT